MGIYRSLSKLNSDDMWSGRPSWPIVLSQCNILNWSKQAQFFIKALLEHIKLQDIRNFEALQQTTPPPGRFILAFQGPFSATRNWNSRRVVFTYSVDLGTNGSI